MFCLQLVLIVPSGQKVTYYRFKKKKKSNIFSLSNPMLRNIRWKQKGNIKCHCDPGPENRDWSNHNFCKLLPWISSCCTWSAFCLVSHPARPGEKKKDLVFEHPSEPSQRPCGLFHLLPWWQPRCLQKLQRTDFFFPASLQRQCMHHALHPVRQGRCSCTQHYPMLTRFHWSKHP